MNSGFVGREKGPRQVGQYILEEKLGEGGMAEVWKARNQVLGTYAAIKFLASGLAGNPEIEQRFLGEGKRQAQLKHRNIVSAFDFLYIEGRSYLVMEYIEGESLDERLFKLQIPMPLPEAFSICRDVLGALSYAHSQNVVHRDIKPANILIENGGRALVMDFGIALAAGEDRLTRAGVAIGTPHYMSPEQIVGARNIDYRSDIYAFGCVLYQMLSQRAPFEVMDGDGDTAYRIKDMHLRRPPVPLRELNPDVPEHVEQAVLRCLAKNPADRFTSCQELLQAITGVAPSRVGPASSGVVPRADAFPARPSPAPLPVSPASLPVSPPASSPYQSPPRPGALAPRYTSQPVQPAATVLMPQEPPRDFAPVVAPPARRGMSPVWIVAGVLLGALVAIGGSYFYFHEKKEVAVAPVTNPQPAPLQPSPIQPSPTQPAQTNDTAAQNGAQQPVANTRKTNSAAPVSGNSTAPDAPSNAPSGPSAHDGKAPDANPPLPVQVDKPAPNNPQPAQGGKPVDNSSQPVQPNPAPAGDLSGHWDGEFKNLGNHQTTKITVEFSQQGAETVTGTLTFNLRSGSTGTCSLSGLYNPQRQFMVLDIASCAENPPHHLQGRFGFSSVTLDGHTLMGVDTLHNCIVELNKN